MTCRSRIEKSWELALLPAGRLMTALAMALGGSASALAAPFTERVSIGSGGVQANGESSPDAISGDGRFVVFTSRATNLVPGDTNNTGDVFVRDRQSGTTQRIDVGPGGVQANGGSFGWSITPNGRYVAFESFATNLVPNDTNGCTDAFVRDLSKDTTRRVSIGAGFAQANGCSSDLRQSADGRYVAFTSNATNLVPGFNNGRSQVYVRDRTASSVLAASVGSGGAQASFGAEVAAISANGRFVLFDSESPDLVPGKTDGQRDVFVRDLQASFTQRVSLTAQGDEADSYSSAADISANGRFVLFESIASNLVAGDSGVFVNVFVKDRASGAVERVSIGQGGGEANNHSSAAEISADGRVVTFMSNATNLVAGDTNNKTDVFVRDRQSGTTRRVSVSSSGAQSFRISGGGQISADGHFALFASPAPNLVPGDTNGTQDVFIRRLD